MRAKFWCFCMEGHPSSSGLQRVWDLSCGSPCNGEEQQRNPRSYCGEAETFAAYSTKPTAADPQTSQQFTASAATTSSSPTSPEGSCKQYGCNGSYVAGRPCQCTSKCSFFGNCCSDNRALCLAEAHVDAIKPEVKHTSRSSGYREEKGEGHKEDAEDFKRGGSLGHPGDLRKEDEQAQGTSEFREEVLQRKDTNRRGGKEEVSGDGNVGRSSTGDLTGKGEEEAEEEEEDEKDEDEEEEEAEEEVQEDEHPRLSAGRNRSDVASSADDDEDDDGAETRERSGKDKTNEATVEALRQRLKQVASTDGEHAALESLDDTVQRKANKSEGAAKMDAGEKSASSSTAHRIPTSSVEPRSKEVIASSSSSSSTSTEVKSARTATTATPTTKSTSLEPTSTETTTQATTTIAWKETTTTLPWKSGVPRGVIKGISYAPVPLRSPRLPMAGYPLPDDDFMSEHTEVLWGSQGRGDLAVMKSLGANAVRLYGNDASLDKRGFLDEAKRQGLNVIAGISDYPYLQMPGNCAKHTYLNCYSQVRAAYKANLERGFLLDRDGEKVYHPALLTIILMNEPDLKFLPAGRPEHFCKALVSAFDAVLDAEQELGVVGPKPNFTVTFSFGVCPHCYDFQYKPGLGQMAELRRAMRNPEFVNYTARNDLWKAYQERFENSVNTANPADSLNNLFLKPYHEHFPGVPVFIGEYHSPATHDQTADLQEIIRLASDESSLLKGLSFFEFQARYDKGGSELSFGMFGLGDKPLGRFKLTDNSLNYTAWCLTPLAAPRHVDRCGDFFRDVEYVQDVPNLTSNVWGLGFDNTETPEDCCAKCLELPVCKSWTWIAAGHTVENRHRCRLSGAEPPKAPRKAQGIVSGVPAERVQIQRRNKRDREPTEEAVSATAPYMRVEMKEAVPLEQPPVPNAVAAAFGGPGPEGAALCPATAIQYW